MSDVFRWSFSQWEAYYQCPRKWHHKSVLRTPGLPPGPAAARGTAVHASVEQYIIGKADEPDMTVIKPKYLPVLDEFKNHENGDRHCEFKVTLDSDWGVCGHSDPNRSLVGFLDAVRCLNQPILKIGEWKTGKPKETHGEQRKMYAAFGLIKWCHVEEVHVTTYYLEDTEKPQQLVAKRSALPKLITIWDERKLQMQRDQIHAPRPGLHCRWCDYSATRGGQCEFS